MIDVFQLSRKTTLVPVTPATPATPETDYEIEDNNLKDPDYTPSEVIIIKLFIKHTLTFSYVKSHLVHQKIWLCMPVLMDDIAPIQVHTRRKLL